jgi:hypothetical protein
MFDPLAIIIDNFSLYHVKHVTTCFYYGVGYRGSVGRTTTCARPWCSPVGLLDFNTVMFTLGADPELGALDPDIFQSACICAT